MMEPTAPGVAVAEHLEVTAFQAGVGELNKLTDPLCFIKHCRRSRNSVSDEMERVSLLADGPEVVGQQRVQRIGVGVQLGLAEGSLPLEPADVGIMTDPVRPYAQTECRLRKARSTRTIRPGYEASLYRQFRIRARQSAQSVTARG